MYLPANNQNVTAGDTGFVVFSHLAIHSRLLLLAHAKCCILAIGNPHLFTEVKLTSCSSLLPFGLCHRCMVHWCCTLVVCVQISLFWMGWTDIRVTHVSHSCLNGIKISKQSKCWEGFLMLCFVNWTISLLQVHQSQPFQTCRRIWTC